MALGEDRSASAGRASTAAPVSDREERILGIIETARGKRAKFRDERVTMAHGAGGKATLGMIEGLFAPAFGGQQSMASLMSTHPPLEKRLEQLARIQAQLGR